MGVSRASASKAGRARRAGASAGPADGGEAGVRSGEAFVSRCLYRLRLSEATALTLLQGGVAAAVPRRGARRVSPRRALPARRAGRISAPIIAGNWRAALAVEHSLQTRYPLVQALLDELAHS